MPRTTSWFLFAGIVLLAYSEVFAQSSSTVNTSTTSLDYQFHRFVESMEMTYKNLSAFSTQAEDESEFEGKIDYDEAPTGRMLSELQIGYRISKKTLASIVGVWSMQPQADESAETRTFEILDPYFKIGVDEIIESGNFAFSSDLRVGTGASRESVEMGKIVSFGSEQEIEYQFGKSPVSFEMEIYFQYNMVNGDQKHNDLDARFEPALMYSFVDTVYGRLSYESQMRHERHDKMRLIDNREATVQTGLGWQTSKKLQLYPFVDVNTRKPGTKDALYGALITWNIL